MTSDLCQLQPAHTSVLYGNGDRLISKSHQKQGEVSVMSNMHRLRDQYKVLISNWWNASPPGCGDNLHCWFICGSNALQNTQHPCTLVSCVLNLFVTSEWNPIQYMWETVHPRKTAASYVVCVFKPWPRSFPNLKPSTSSYYFNMKVPEP